MKVIVISITQYKENDGIIDTIAEDGGYSFLAKGLFAPKSKNALLNNNLVVADVDFIEGNYKYPILKRSDIISFPVTKDSSLEYYSSILIIAEATKNMLQDEEKEHIFPILLDVVEGMKNAKNFYIPVIYYLANLLKVSGYDIEVRECVNCASKKDIVAFSFDDGGFLCSKCCISPSRCDLNGNQLFLIRHSFLAQKLDDIKDDISMEDSLIVLNKFLEFIEENYGVRFTSIGLLNK